MATIDLLPPTAPPQHLDLAEVFASKSGVYCLRVRGDSLVDRHILDGDYVVIERRKAATNDDLVVATSGGKSGLMPAMTVPADAIVHGVMIGLIRGE